MQSYSMGAYAPERFWDATAIADFDASYALFCIKPNAPHRLVPLAPAQAFVEQGVTDLMLKQMWNAADDTDQENFWGHAGRATMAALFICGSGLVEPDAAYGYHLLATMPEGRRVAALEIALYHAVAHHAPVALVTMLLSVGANPNCDLGLYDWRSALALAVEHRAHDVVRAMLEHGADPHWQGQGRAESGHGAAVAANDLVALELFAEAGRALRSIRAAPLERATHR